MIYIIWLIVIFGIIFCLDSSIQVKTHVIESNKVIHSVRFAVIADFHSQHASEVLSVLNKQSFDGILICGDLIDERYDLSQVDLLLQSLPNCPKYYVIGNHEFRIEKTLNYQQLIEYLEKYNVECIDEKVIEVQLNDEIIQLIGMKDHCFLPVNKREEYNLNKSNELKQQAKNNLFTVCMMHRPECYTLFDDMDCLVSGHAHGGQIRLGSLMNGLFAPQQGFFPKRAGGEYWLKSGGKHIVSRGLAKFWYLPRFLNHRELNIIEIKGKDKK